MILTLSELLLQRLTASDGRILRDKVLRSFCLKLNKRNKTFLIATSVHGKQVRITIGRWPLLSVEEAHGLAVKALIECRGRLSPARVKARKFPTLLETLPEYCEAKNLKTSSQKRYSSIISTHFAEW